MKKLFLAGIALAIATPASASDFTAMSGCGEGHSDKPCTSIYINGKIEPEDGAKWKAFLETINTPHAIVTLNSPGGSATAGLLIAYDILNREYDTYFNEGICTSMCAMIWLAGKTRYMSSGATLGFHQARKDIPGTKTMMKSRWGNDLAFDYYAKLKLPEKAMRYLFSAGPNDLALVTVDKAVELGLRPEVWPKSEKSDVQPIKEPEKPATKSLDRLTAAAANGRAQSKEIDEIKGKIFDAHMAQQSFSGLKFCSELNGTSFYFQMRNRILNLEEYFRSLESLVKAGVYNPAKRRAWTLEDAKERWEEVKRQAQDDKRKCELVQGLPKLEKRLQELQAATDKKE